MLTANLLAKKRDGHELTDDEIRFLIDGFCRNEVADYQMSAFAMAVCVRGMVPRETATLTKAMLESGERLPREPSGDRPRVDKHSTGGLGDKVSLILAPLLAACGVHVPMVSGRGLGLTGGTLDKLEALPGFNCNLSAEESSKVLQDVGAFIVSASEKIAPADRRLYALRDVTGTVESVPLITASILSKKLSAHLDALVMDVKLGSGAFMKTADHASRLATSLETVGTQAGLPTSVVISEMDQPLGCAVGNANEVNESVAILSARRRDEPQIERVRELTVILCSKLLVQVGVAADEAQATEQLCNALDSGAAMERFEKMIAAQGARWKEDLAVAPGQVLTSPMSGCVASVDCQQIGSAVVAMGGGRRRVDDKINPAVGIEMKVQIGQMVQQGQPLLSIHPHAGDKTDYLDALKDAVHLSEEVVPENALVIERLREGFFKGVLQSSSSLRA